MKKFTKVLAVVLAIATLSACLCFTLTACNKNDKETIIVGYTLFSPMNYQNENGELIGFDTDLAKKVFTDLGYNVVFKEIEWNNKYADLESGAISCIWNGFTSNSDDNGTPRNQTVDFSYQYMKNYQAVVVKSAEAANYTDIASSFNNKVGATEKGSAGEERVADFTGAINKEATSQMSALQDLLGGGCNFAVVDYLLANSIVGKSNFASLSIVDKFNSDAEYYAIGFKKGSDLTAKVNAQLEKYLADGSLVALATQYGLENALVKDYSVQVY